MTRNVPDFIKGTYLQEAGNQNFNLFHGTGENAVGTQSGAMLSVSGPGGSYKDLYQLEKEADDYDTNPEDDDEAFPPVRDNDGRIVYEHSGKFDGRSPVRQGVLFQDTRRPPLVTSMISTKDTRHMTPAMLEAANKESLKRWQQPVQPGDEPNLSSYSLPMVNRLKRAGLASGPEVEDVTNNYDWETAHSEIQEAKKYYKKDEATELDSNEFSQGGRDFVKRLSAAEKSRGIKSTPAEPKPWRVGERYYSNQKETDEGLMRKMSNSGRRDSFQDELPGMGI